MVQLREQLAIEPMREADVPTVQEIEREIFSTPWPRNAYYRELSSRNSAYYVVLRSDEEIIGYGGMWRGGDGGPRAEGGGRGGRPHRGVLGALFSGAGAGHRSATLTLGVETSCDESSVAVLDGRRVLANLVHSQQQLHEAYGGVVPELAAREHLERLPGLVDSALAEAEVSPADIELLA